VTAIIRVSEDTFERLQKYAVFLGGSPETAIIRLMSFFECQGEPKSLPEFPGYREEQLDPAPMESTYDKKVEILLGKIHSAKTYGEIPVWNKKIRPFFPGLRNPFILETDICDINAWVTSASKGARTGDPYAGRYITCSDRSGKLKDWYKQHPGLKDGSVLVIEKSEGGKRYKLGIKTE